MFTELCLSLLVYSSSALDITQEIDANCGSTSSCDITLSSTETHTLSHAEISMTMPISITSSSETEPATIMVETPLQLTDYNSVLTFDNVIIDGSQSESNFLQITTNNPMQLNILNSQIINFNSATAAISITETIETFNVYDNDDNTVVNITNQNDSFVEINFDNSQFTNNTNTASNGGVLSLVGHEYRLNIDACAFTNNKVTGWRKSGGCISWDRSATPDPLDTESISYQTTNTSNTWTYTSVINLRNSNFSNNYGEDAAGVLYIGQTTAYDTGIYTIPNNYESTTTEIEIIRDFTLNSEGNIYSGNTAGEYGGVFRHYGYTEKQESEYDDIELLCDDSHYRISIIGDTYINNAVTEDSAKSYGFGGTLSSTCAQVTVTGSYFSGGYAKYGSAVSLYASSSVNIDHCVFDGNDGHLGTVYIIGLLNSTEGYYAQVTNSNFSGNTASSEGAGILGTVLDELIVENCRFENNWNKFYGTISLNYFATYNQMSVEIIGSHFTNNYVDSDVQVAGGAITAQSFSFSDNDPQLNCFDASKGTFEDVQDLNVLIDECVFTNNRQSAVGLRLVSAYINNSEFTNNSNTKSNGGAIQSYFSWFKVKKCNFSDNMATDTGGAISTTLNNYIEIYPNWAFYPSNDGGQLCKIEVTESRFLRNSAGDDNDGLGGAIFIGTDSSITGNVFTGNKAGYGGALAINGYSIIVQGNQFRNNNAETHGGCLFQTKYSNYGINDDDSAATTDSEIRMEVRQNAFNNCSSYNGGGAFLRASPNEKLLITDNNFTECLAEDVGGGLVVGQLEPLLEFEFDNDTNMFLNNSAKRAFDDYVSNPNEMYIKCVDSNGSVEQDCTTAFGISPGISATAALGAYDLFGQDFVSFMITDYFYKESNFEFSLITQEEPPFELLTVNKGSLSAGRAVISFVIQNRTDASLETANISIGSNMDSLIGIHTQTWNLVECPSGYGYNLDKKLCELCEQNTFKVNQGWTTCWPCLNGLSCRGGENVQILHKNWWSAAHSEQEETFFCRLGECCSDEAGCAPDDEKRCPDDRNPESIGCGECAAGLSAMHGSHVCSSDCEAYGNGWNIGAIIAFAIWPIVLVFLFGLAKYDGDIENKGVDCKEFYSIAMIEITVIVLIDYYQSLPAILTFEPDKGTYFLINLCFARIPITDSGICLFNDMTILQKTYWDLLIPSLILILSFLILAVSTVYNWRVNKNRSTATEQRLNIVRLKYGWMYDPLRSIMFSMFFCIIPMLWSCSQLFTCIEYGETDRFWNAPGQTCDKRIVIAMSVIFFILSTVYIASNIYYSDSHLLNHEEISNNKKLIPLYLQRVQPFYFMVYPFRDKNTRRASKISKNQNLTWQNIEYRSKRHFKYLYVGWVSPFIRKITCLLIYNCVTGETGQSDQTFIVTNLILVTLVTYQLFSQDYTSQENFTLHLYCMYLLFWLILLIVSGSTKIISENLDSMDSLRVIVNVIMWIPFVCAIISISMAIAFIKKPQLLERAKPKPQKKGLDKRFHSARSILSDVSRQKSKSDEQKDKEDVHERNVGFRE